MIFWDFYFSIQVGINSRKYYEILHKYIRISFVATPEIGGHSTGNFSSFSFFCFFGAPVACTTICFFRPCLDEKHLSQCWHACERTPWWTVFLCLDILVNLQKVCEHSSHLNGFSPSAEENKIKIFKFLEIANQIENVLCHLYEIASGYEDL